MTMTENQAKAADLLSMMREHGMYTMAGEVQELLAGAWDEGEVLGESMEFGYRKVENPYRDLPVRSSHLGTLEELPCQRCGRRNPIWYADHPAWNLAVGGPDARDDPGGVLCPSCFHERWLAATEQEGEEFLAGACQGHSECPVDRHEHGCFADDGTNCDHPEDHEPTDPVRCGEDVQGTVPSLVGSGRIDPCPCVRPAGHEPPCVCAHGEPDDMVPELTEQEKP